MATGALQPTLHTWEDRRNNNLKTVNMCVCVQL